MPDQEKIEVKRQMTVLDHKEVHRGQNKKGNEYVIYELTAKDADGNPIETALRSFEQLPENELQEFTLTKYEKNGYVSWTVSQKGNGGNRLGPKVDKLREEVNALAKRVEALEQGTIPAAAGGDDDIPF